MKFKDTQIGDRLTVWHLSQRQYVLKIADDAAVNLATGEIVHIHKNKAVEVSERLTPDYQIGIVGGEVVALRKMDTHHFELVNIVRIGGRIVGVGEVKLMEKKQEEVYIIFRRAVKRLDNAERQLQGARGLLAELILDQELSVEHSSLEHKTPLSLPGE
jgi:hypothetical protein